MAVQDATPYTVPVHRPTDVDVWTRSSSHATTLLVSAADKLGLEFLGIRREGEEPDDPWDAETIVRELTDALGQPPSRICVDKLLAAITIRTTDLFFNRADVFQELCNVLSGSYFNPQEFDPADAMECAWGIIESLLIGTPEPDEDGKVFSEEVCAYVRLACEEEGLYDPPDVLAIGGNPGMPTGLPDDPDVLEEVLRVGHSRKSEIKAGIQMGLMTLIEELKSLNLRWGDTTELVSRIRQTLKK